jgi:hypothetical protein
VKVLVKTKGTKRRKLNKLGKAKVAVKLTYTPDGVKSNSEKAHLKLKKKR